MTKYNILICLAFLLGLGCKSAQEKASMRDLYISEFKVVYFKTLLKKGFNNSPEYLKAVDLDNSHFTEPLLSEESYNLIEKYTTQDNDLMTKDSLESFGRRAEGGEGKQVFYFALEKYNSKWLDSIAKVEAKNYLKSGQER